MAVFKCGGHKRLDHDGVQICTYESTVSWRGLCPGCGRLYDRIKVGADVAPKTRVTAASLAEEPPIEYTSTNVSDFDRVIGGGLVEGSVYLFGGGRGVGKSSLLFMVADGVARGRRRVLYASGEQNNRDLAGIVQRLGIKNEQIDIMGDSCDAYEIVRRAEEDKPFMFIVDSLQVAICSDVSGSEGSIAQCEAVLQVITGHCKRTKQCAIVINHVNKGGDFAGSATMQHLADTLVRFDYDYDYDDDGNSTDVGRRELSIFEKNRNGSARETALFEMTDTGQLVPWETKKKARRSRPDPNAPSPPRLYPVK